MYRTKNNVYHITTTRFNEETYKENQRYRENVNHVGAIYGSPSLITEKIPRESRCIVIEMLNHKKTHDDYPGKIMGISIIKNITLDRHVKIYKTQNYNRYTYYGKYRITRENIEKLNMTLLNELEAAVFKGKDHLKRAQGITKVPEHFSQKVNNVGERIIKLFKIIFKNETNYIQKMKPVNNYENNNK